jgi:endonuclease YncB( thermonuclease family)
LRFSITTCFFLIAVVFLSVPPIVDVVNGSIKGIGLCSIALVMDGDSVKIDCPDSDIRNARIMGYDTPEKNARCIGEFFKATRATWALRIMLWRARNVEIKIDGKDKYGRALIHLLVNGNDVTPEMVRTGVARIYNGGRRGSWCE